MEVIKDGVKIIALADNHTYINPKNFTEADLPIIVLCDDLRSFTGWAIKAHTSGDYNHAFIIHKPGLYVSQNFTGFKESHIEDYLRAGMMLKFWTVSGLTENEKSIIQQRITQRLKLPWWRRSYDFIGVFIGQFFNLRWLQNPFQEFCSEEVWDDFILSINLEFKDGERKPNPAELNTIFINNIPPMKVLGYWWLG